MMECLGAARFPETEGWSALARLPRCAVLAAALALAVSPAEAANSLVTIEGGTPDRHNYKWSVANHHTSPIVYVEFPHYHADLFTVPPRWKAETTFLVNVGVPDKPGICVARPEGSNPGIIRGNVAEFEMRIASSGALVGKGVVKIRFADGEGTTGADVELPQPPASDFKFVPLLGAAIIFAAWVVVRTLRERRRRAVGPTDSEPSKG